MARREAAIMGYELETASSAAPLDVAADVRFEPLERRWHAANGRLAVALAGYRSLRGQVAPDDPVWIAAQLRVAEARQRCREVADEIEVFGLTRHAGRFHR